jgi:hypothetical protein
VNNDTRIELFQDTVARPLLHGWALMNRQSTGYASSAIGFSTLLEMTSAYRVRLGEWGSDEHGEFVHVHRDDRCAHGIKGGCRRCKAVRR